MKASVGLLIIGFISGVISYYYLGGRDIEIQIVEKEVIRTVEVPKIVIRETKTHIINSPTTPKNITVDPKQQHCMALNMYRESGNQSIAGMIAIGRVVMNRVSDRRFPDNPCDVIYAGPLEESSKTRGKNVPDKDRIYYPVKYKCQFSWYCDGKPDEVVDTDSIVWKNVNDIVYQILAFDSWSGFLEGATHYHADYVSPTWSKKLQLITTIDNHKFYRWD